MSLAAITKFYFYNELKLIYQQQMQLGVDKRDFLHTFRFNQLNAWVAPLPWLAEQAKNRTNINPEKIHTIPLGIEINLYNNAKLKKKAGIEFFNLPENKKTIGILGRIDPHKGQKELIEAFHLMNNAELILLIVGEPTKNEGDKYFNELLALIEKYHLNDKVFIRPFTHKTELFYAVCDVFVMGTKGETYGMVTLEAIASKCVVVGNNTGGTKELVKPFCGELYENGNLEDMANKIQLAIQKQSKYYPEPESTQYINQFSHEKECGLFVELMSKL
jgi:glycosyltransferase involved in cell wall biosynthesis